ncbi:MAG: peptidoglycan DD-metalloendopeptidase family protein [Candidatus Komeilibacteria bacterium]
MLKSWLVKIFLVVIILTVAVAAGFLASGQLRKLTKYSNKVPWQEAQAQAKAEQPSQIIEIPSGETFSTLLQDNGISANDTQAIIDASHDVYDLATVRAGKKIELYNDESGALKKLIYNINTEEYLQVVRDLGPGSGDSGSVSNEVSSTKPQAPSPNLWVAQKIKVPYEVKIQTVKGTVKDMLYTSALEQGIDELLVLDLADLFQWQVDFALDIRNGDSYKVIYEARYLDGKYVMPGKILAAEFVNQGQTYRAYYFADSNGTDGYYDKDGNSTQKMFLKAPVSFRYVSSGFTTGLRYISAFNISTGHRAIDYAAASGTPIRATADGTVTFAGWSSGGYGRLTSIRHNATYSTNYGHQSKIIVKVGQKVKQGQTIGYVGSTGFSTGPHLHYEMVKNGTKINPQKEVLPPGQALAKDQLPNFTPIVDQYSKQLDSV